MWSTSPQFLLLFLLHCLTLPVHLFPPSSVNLKLSGRRIWSLDPEMSPLSLFLIAQLLTAVGLCLHSTETTSFFTSILGTFVSTRENATLPQRGCFHGVTMQAGVLFSQQLVQLSLANGSTALMRSSMISWFWQRNFILLKFSLYLMSNSFPVELILVLLGTFPEDLVFLVSFRGSSSRRVFQVLSLRPFPPPASLTPVFRKVKSG